MRIGAMKKQSQNKANFKTEVRPQMTEDRKQKSAKSGLTKDYENERVCSAYSAEVATKAGPRKQTQSKPISKVKRCCCV